MKIYQEKNLNTPIFEGFISSILFYLILTIPLAFIYGMIRKQIERKEKHRVGYDFVPLIISKDGFQIITTKGQVMIPFNQVLKVSGWKKRTTTAAWFNSREIVYPFGKLNIKTINQKYNIKNIAYIEEVVFFLNHFISNPIKFKHLTNQDSEYVSRAMYEVFKSKLRFKRAHIFNLNQANEEEEQYERDFIAKIDKVLYLSS